MSLTSPIGGTGSIASFDRGLSEKALHLRFHCSQLLQEVLPVALRDRLTVMFPWTVGFSFIERFFQDLRNRALQKSRDVLRLNGLQQAERVSQVFKLVRRQAFVRLRD